MGITCKPCGKWKSILTKINNEQIREKAAIKKRNSKEEK